jgi:hypothetical protein
MNWKQKDYLEDQAHTLFALSGMCLIFFINPWLGSAVLAGIYFINAWKPEVAV